MMKPGKAYMIGRAEVSDPALREKFDRWYETHHLPLAVEKMKAECGWRFWCRSDPSVHFAIYQFPDYEFMRRRFETEDVRFLIADFDRAWPGGVTRTRELVELVQAITPKG